MPCAAHSRMVETELVLPIHSLPCSSQCNARYRKRALVYFHYDSIPTLNFFSLLFLLPPFQTANHDAHTHQHAWPRSLARQDFTTGDRGWWGRSAEPRCAPARPAPLAVAALCLLLCLCVCTQRNDGARAPAQSGPSPCSDGTPSVRLKPLGVSAQQRDAGATGGYPPQPAACRAPAPPALASPTRRTVKDARRSAGRTPSPCCDAYPGVLSSPWPFPPPFPVLRTPSKPSMESPSNSKPTVHGEALLSGSLPARSRLGSRRLLRHLYRLMRPNIAQSSKGRHEQCHG